MTVEHNDEDWVVAYASVIGNGHIQSNIPCQDNCEHLRLNDTWGVAVVCDGAGSAKFSHIGSDFVSRNVAHCLQEVIERRQWATVDDLPTEEEWRQEAMRAAQLVMQRLVQFAKNKGYTLGDLGCTLLASLYSPFAILTVHIGDGRAAYSVQPNEWHALITPFRGSEANETVFITSGIWTEEGVKQYIGTNIKTGTIRGFALMSDGCEKAAFEVNILDPETNKYTDPNRPFTRFFEPNVPGLRKLHKENKSQEEINSLWSGFLKAGTKQFKHEIDDKTMILGVSIEEVPIVEKKKESAVVNEQSPHSSTPVENSDSSTNADQ